MVVVVDVYSRCAVAAFLLVRADDPGAQNYMSAAENFSSVKCPQTSAICYFSSHNYNIAPLSYTSLRSNG